MRPGIMMLLRPCRSARRHRPRQAGSARLRDAGKARGRRGRAGGAESPRRGSWLEEHGRGPGRGGAGPGAGVGARAPRCGPAVLRLRSRATGGGPGRCGCAQGDAAAATRSAGQCRSTASTPSARATRHAACSRSADARRRAGARCAPSPCDAHRATHLRVADSAPGPTADGPGCIRARSEGPCRHPPPGWLLVQMTRMQCPAWAWASRIRVCDKLLVRLMRRRPPAPPAWARRSRPPPRAPPSPVMARSGPASAARARRSCGRRSSARRCPTPQYESGWRQQAAPAPLPGGPACSRRYSIEAAAPRVLPGSGGVPQRSVLTSAAQGGAQRVIGSTRAYLAPAVTRRGSGVMACTSSHVSRLRSRVVSDQNRRRRADVRKMSRL
jgi:hypothetical protein